MEARLVGDDYKDVRPGPKSPGELWVRGPVVMKFVSRECSLVASFRPAVENTEHTAHLLQGLPRE